MIAETGVICNRRSVYFCIAVADTISLSLRFNELRSANLHKYDTASRAIDHTAIQKLRLQYSINEETTAEQNRCRLHHRRGI